MSESPEKWSVEVSKDASIMLEKLPKFPENPLGLKRGSFLTVISPEVEKSTGLKVGRHIPIGYDGEFIRSGGLTWSIDTLVGEISDRGWWEVAEEEIDLSDPNLSLKFAREVERLFLN
ncbi:MAG: hypothetical protein Q8R55_02190 [Candidatus Taylorbacteria bacterium]|nr:hypothetical protein [Candidatus Taylorbacteria bacterium]